MVRDAKVIPQAKIYQVGLLTDASPDDPHFNAWHKAARHARELTENYDAIGVWASQAEGGSLLAIIYDGKIFVQWI